MVFSYVSTIFFFVIARIFLTLTESKLAHIHTHIKSILPVHSNRTVSKERTKKQANEPTNERISEMDERTDKKELHWMVMNIK